MSSRDYPYSLDRKTETAFLQELASITAVLLWRADEIEACAKEHKKLGAIPATPGHGWWNQAVAGPIRLFGAMEAFLAAWARASLILHPVRSAAEARGRHLRAAVGLHDHWVGLSVENRVLRNGWMHLDENLDEWAVHRTGHVAGGELTPEYRLAHERALAGAIRVISVEPPSVLLPQRGAWNLRPFFHHAKDLHARVARTLDATDRWIAHRDVEGLAVGWGGFPQCWEVRSLGEGPTVSAEGETPVAAIEAFRRAVDQLLDA